MTGDDHNTDALIAALRSPALPAERAGEAAAVTAMLGVLARAPASTRFRAGRGIAIAVVTVASLGVGGLAAAGPGVFQAAASKARSFVTDHSAETSADAGAANGGDPHRGSLLDDTDGVGSSAAALALAAQQAATTGDCSGVACAAGTSPTAAVNPIAPPPECADGNHGDAVSVVANSSVPPSAEQDHAVTDVARDACTPQGPQGNGVPGGTNPNQPEDKPEGPPISTPNGNGDPGGDATPNTGPPPSTPGGGNSNGNGQTPGPGGGQGGGQGAGQDSNNGQGSGQGANNGQDKSTTPAASVPPDNGQGTGKANGKSNGG